MSNFRRLSSGSKQEYVVRLDDIWYIRKYPYVFTEGIEVIREETHYEVYLKDQSKIYIDKKSYEDLKEILL